MTLACVFVANCCKTTRAGSRRYGLNGRCPFFRVLSILTAISPAQMSRNHRIKPWSSENEKKDQIFIVTKPRFQGLCGGVIQNGGQLPLRKDPGNDEGPSILGAYHLAYGTRARSARGSQNCAILSIICPFTANSAFRLCVSIYSVERKRLKSLFAKLTQINTLSIRFCRLLTLDSKITA